MLPLALLSIIAGWFDLPPAPAQLPPLSVRLMGREELLARRRAGRAARRRRRAVAKARAAFSELT